MAVNSIGYKKGAFFIVFACVAFLLASSSVRQIEASGGGNPVLWSVTNHRGQQVSSTSLAGKVTVVNFWATWCIPCVVEIPTLNSVAKKYEKYGVKVVGVSVDAQSNAMLQAFVDKFNMTYTVALSNPGILSGFRVSDSVPMTFILDQQGRIVRKHSGYVKSEELEKDIRSLLKI